MAIVSAFIRRHPVLCFYALVFVISWGGILALVGPRGIPGTREQVESLMPLVLVPLFLGPSIAGLVMTGLVRGRAGFRELRTRLLHWRVGARWYAVALLTGPLLVSAILLTLSLISPDFTPGIVRSQDRLGLLIFGIAWGLIGGGLLEELGWTGFAVPTLRRSHGAVATALIVGALWGAWHFLVAFWAGGAFAGEHSLGIYLVTTFLFYEGALPAYRVLMVWVYDRTGSLPVAMLMHAGLSASTLILQPAATGMPFLIWNLALVVALWVIVGAVGMAKFGHVWPHRLARRAV